MRIISALFLFLISGCSQIYTYNGVTYTSKAEALRAVRADNADAVSRVIPFDSAKKVGGTIKILIPDRQRIREKGVITVGQGTVSSDSVDYVAQTLSIGYDSMASAVQRAKIFDDVITFHSYNTELPPSFSSDFLLRFHMQDAETAQWYLHSKSNPTRAVSVPVDTGITADRRLNAWLIQLKETANAIRGAYRDEPRVAERKAEPKSSGTGFFVTKGYIVTNNHVVNACRTTSVGYGGTPSISATVVATDDINDLAVLKTSLKAKNHIELRAGKNIRPGDEVTVFGFPLRGILSATGSVTTGSVSSLAGLGNDTRLLQISAPVQSGNSGGPVLDSSGNLVGVVVSKLNALRLAEQSGDISQNVNFAIKGSVLNTFLDSHDIHYTTADSTRSLSAAAVGEKAIDASVYIECH